MTEQTPPSRAEARFTSWFMVALGGAGAIATGIDMLGAHLAGWLTPKEGVTGDSIGLTASVFVAGLGWLIRLDLDRRDKPVPGRRRRRARSNQRVP